MFRVKGKIFREGEQRGRREKEWGQGQKGEREKMWERWRGKVTIKWEDQRRKL